MKIKCVKFPCERCGNLATIQVFYNKSGVVKYARARHYLNKQNGKPQFEYHQQSLQYLEKKLGELSYISITKNDQHDSLNIDQLNLQSSPKLKSMAGPKGFEPLTFSLEG
jgi:hypothetical protein